MNHMEEHTLANRTEKNPLEFHMPHFPVDQEFLQEALDSEEVRIRRQRLRRSQRATAAVVSCRGGRIGP